VRIGHRQGLNIAFIGREEMRRKKSYLILE
jgi:hypothetical protein